MGRKLYTTDSLVQEVRSITDESGTDALDTELDIIPALNRGLGFGVSILARRYPEPFLTSQPLTLTAGEAQYDLPEECFEDRITRLEIATGNGTYQEVRRISHSDAWQYESSTPTPIPQCYTVIGREIRLYPPPTGEFSARTWFIRQPDDLLLPQGRITAISPSSDYVYVDQVGDGVSTASDRLESFVNLVDGQTGLVKGTLQIQATAGGKVTFRSSPTRGTVHNRAVSDAVPATASLDDYICLAAGSCVPQFSQPLASFIVQFAVAECTRKLGGEASTEEQVLAKFEKQVENTWSGRETTRRIKRRSTAWSPLQYRRFPTQR